MHVPKRILLTCTVNLGDVILATSAAALIKQHNPQCHVSMLVKKGIEPILQNSPVLDEVIVLHHKNKERSLRQLWQFVKEIKKRKFDMSISLDRKLRPALIAFLAGIPRRVGPDKVFDYHPSSIGWLYNQIVTTPSDFLHIHQSELFQVIVRGALSISGKAKPVLAPELGATESFDGYISQGRNHKIVLCIRGTYKLKNWPLERFCELVNRLQAQYIGVFYIVGTQSDVEDAQTLCQSVNGEIVNLCGKTTLTELAGILRECDLFITIDTGSMHLAAAMGTPVIGLFRRASLWRWAPLSQYAKALAGEITCNLTDRPEACPVAPCPSLAGQEAFPCVEAITVEQVEGAVLTLLGKVELSDKEYKK